jgi:hypothetical protein
MISRSITADGRPATPELIQGILHRGSKLVLGGSSKSNKTWSLLDMAISVASGKSWWGLPTTKGPVVYVDMELSRKQLFKRVTKILETRGITLERGDLHLISLRGHVSNAVKTVEKIRKSSPAGTSWSHLPWKRALPWPMPRIIPRVTRLRKSQSTESAVAVCRPVMLIRWS